MQEVVVKSARLLFRISPKHFSGLVLLALLTSLLPFISIYLTASVFARAVDLVVSRTDPLAGFKALSIPLLLLGAVTFLSNGLLKYQELSKRRFQLNCRGVIQEMILQKAASLSLSYFEAVQPYSEVQRLSNEASYHPVEVINKLFVVVGALFGLVVASGIAYTWHPWLVPILLISPVIYFGISRKVAASAHRTNRAKERPEMWSMTYSNVMLAEYFAKEIKVFGLKDFFLPRFSREISAGFSLEKKHLRVRALWEAGVGSVLTLERPALFAYAIFSLLTQSITITQFGLYTQSIMSLQAGINSMVSTLSEISHHEYFIRSLDRFLNVQEMSAPRTGMTKVNPPAFPGIPEIEFRDVHFSYPGKAEVVLKGLSFKLFKGETVSIAGKNGSGKSTIAKLIAGLYYPSKGEILIQGRSTSDFPPQELFAHVSFLLQDYAIYHLTVAENIGLGDLARSADTQAIKRLAGSLGIAPFLEGLPAQYNTLIGRFIEAGHSLSGGQEQLIALARSLFKDAPVLILDEPTAALDAQNSLLFFEKVLDPAACADRTTILISHTFKAISRCDRIFYLDDGRIVEEGSHAQLLSAGGKYADDYELNVLERT